MENQAKDPNAASAQYVAVNFCEQYYKLLELNADLIHKYYEDPSDKDAKFDSTVQGISEALRSLDMKAYSPNIRTVDSQYSHDNGVIVLVTGSLDGNNESKKFSQSFFLASRAAEGRKLYFILNDIFRFNNDAAEIKTVVEEAPVKAASENGHHEHGVVETPVEEVKTAPLANGSAKETEAPLANGGTKETEAKAEAVVPAAKKSFASVVNALKLNNTPFHVRGPQLKPAEQQRARAPAVPKPEPAAPDAAPAVNGSPEKKAESAPVKSHAIFVANLPMSATVDELDKVFSQFGPIKRDGIQVRSSKQLGTCFGFVEFESASSMKSALEASPVVFGARKLSIEERRATNDRPKFSSGRGGGYRNDHYRGGRGNYNGNHRGGYVRNNYSGRGRGNGQNAPHNGQAHQKPQRTTTPPEPTA